MMQSDMPTLNGNGSEGEPEVGLMATHFGGKAPLSERFRRAQLRTQMFGDPGETLSIGRYKVLARVGAGAMGTVYRAEDPSLDREVAVKVLHRSDEMHSARMTIEARALAKLSHPNVVTVHEVGTEDGQLFVAMEFVQGRTLQAWLEDPSGPSLLNVFAQAAEGLQAAHDAGIVHRDFKPENVIVGDDGRVRVLDFGMARSPGAPLLQEVEGAAESLQILEPAITRTGMLAGTPSYMAPEQFEGSRVDARADQFAFCIALHEAIWGRRPFAGETMAELAKSVIGAEAELFGSEPAVALPAHELDAATAVIKRGLVSDPDGRFSSMRELSDRLRCIPVTRPPRSRAQSLRVGLFAAGVSAGAIGFLLTYAGPTEDSDLPEPAAVTIPVHDIAVVNHCSGWVEFSMGPTDKPGLDAETHRLEAGHTKRFAMSADEMVWLRNGDGSFGAGLGSSDPNRPFVIGPTCAEIYTGEALDKRRLDRAKWRAQQRQVAAGEAAAHAQESLRIARLNMQTVTSQIEAIQEMRREISGCGLGTEIQNGVCVAVEWDPRFVDCSETPCSVNRTVFFGVRGAPSPLMKQVRVVPTTAEGGEQVGFKLFGVRQNTAPRMVGFESGDLLLAVNGIALTATPSSLAVALTDEVRTAKTLKIAFKRGGEAKTIEVKLHD